MSQPFLTVSAAGLRAARVQLTASEAVACVLLVGDALEWDVDAPDPSGVVLRGDGRIDVTPVSGRTPARVETYARLLHRLLPDATEDAPAGVPGALRLAVARGLGVLDVPPFASARDFRKAIERFVTSSPGDLVMRVMLRWAEAMCSLPDEHPAERRMSGPRVDVLRRMLREADLERYALLHEGTAGRSAASSPPADHDGGVALAARVQELPSIAGTLRSFETAAAVRAPLAARSARTVQGRAVRVVAASVAIAAIGLAAAATLVERPLDLPPPPGSPEVSDVRAPAAGAPMPPPASERRDAPPRQAAVAESPAPAAPAMDTMPPRDPVAAHRVEDRVVGTHGIEEDLSSSPGAVSAGFALASVADGPHPAENVSLSPDGTRVAFDSDREGLRGVYVADRTGANVRRVSGPGAAAAPAWTPDGHGLAILRAEPDLPGVMNLWLLDLESGQERRLTAYRFGEISPASWLPDGRRLCYGQGGRLHVRDTQSGVSRSYESPVPGQPVAAVAASPDGRHVAFHVKEHGAWLLDLRDGSMRRAIDDPSVRRLVWSPSGHGIAYYSGRDDQWKVWVMAAR